MVRKLGEGGCSSVYEVLDNDGETRYAIKIFKSGEGNNKVESIF